MEVLGTLLFTVMALAAMCEGQPAWFKDKENELLKTLMAAKNLKLNQKEEKGLKNVIDDVEEGRDPEKEDETIRMELAYAFRNLMSLNPYQEEQIRQDFRQALGDDLAYEIFEEGEKITEEELRKKQHVQKDLDFSRREKGAWKHVVSDAKRDRDMTDHNKSILKRITIDASKIYALPPEEFEAEKAMLVMSYGPETAQRMLDGIRVVHDEVKSKAHAKSEAEMAMKQVLAGKLQEGKDVTHDQANAAGANPAQAPAAAANPAQAPAAIPKKAPAAAADPAQGHNEASKRKKGQSGGANSVKVQNAAANPAQGQNADAKRTQGQNADANPDQVQNAAGRPAQGQNAGAKPDQVQNAAANPSQVENAAARPAQVQNADAKRAQGQNAGAKRTQAQNEAANPGQVQNAAANPSQVQNAAARPAQVQNADAKRTQGQNAGAKRTQGQNAAADPAKEQTEPSKPAQEKAEAAKPAAQAPPQAAERTRGKATKGQSAQLQTKGATPTEVQDVGTDAT